MAFEKIGSEEIWRGHIGTVRVDRFRHDDGEEVQREVVAHPGAAVMVPWDGERIWLVRQPREVVGEELLELPAGKLNGGEPLETAKRELREEIGKSAATWRYLTSFYASPGFTDELIHAYLATDLRDDPLAGRGGGADHDRLRAGRAARRPDRQLQGLEEHHHAVLVPGLRAARPALAARSTGAPRPCPNTHG